MIFETTAVHVGRPVVRGLPCGPEDVSLLANNAGL